MRHLAGLSPDDAGGCVSAAGGSSVGETSQLHFLQVGFSAGVPVDARHLAEYGSQHHHSGRCWKSVSDCGCSSGEKLLAEDEV